MFYRVACAIGLVALAASCTTDIGPGDVPRERIMEIGHYVVAAGPGPGLHIQAVNQLDTECLDETRRAACPIDSVVYTTAGLSDDAARSFDASFRAGHAIVEGWQQSQHTRDGGLVRTLFAVDPWVSATPVRPEATVYNVIALDIVCVRDPCPEYLAQPIGAVSGAYVHVLDLMASGADGAYITGAYEALTDGDILVAGTIRGPDEDIASYAPEGIETLAARTFYLRAR